MRIKPPRVLAIRVEDRVKDMKELQAIIAADLMAYPKEYMTDEIILRG
jgi:hypothetical protein